MDYQENFLKMISPTGRRVFVTNYPHHARIAASLSRHFEIIGLRSSEATEAVKQLQQALNRPLEALDLSSIERRFMISDEIGAIEDDYQDRRHQTHSKSNHVVRRGKGQRKSKGGTRWE